MFLPLENSRQLLIQWSLRKKRKSQTYANVSSSEHREVHFHFDTSRMFCLIHRYLFAFYLWLYAGVLTDARYFQLTTADGEGGRFGPRLCCGSEVAAQRAKSHEKSFQRKKVSVRTQEQHARVGLREEEQRVRHSSLRLPHHLSAHAAFKCYRK